MWGVTCLLAAVLCHSSGYPGGRAHHWWRMLRDGRIRTLAGACGGTALGRQSLATSGANFGPHARKAAYQPIGSPQNPNVGWLTCTCSHAQQHLPSFAPRQHTKQLYAGCWCTRDPVPAADGARLGLRRSCWRPSVYGRIQQHYIAGSPQQVRRVAILCS